MNLIQRVTLWLRSAFQRQRLDREMHDEMNAHLDRAVERLMARGLSRVEAQRMAVREFGHLDQLHERGRDARGGRWLEAVLADVRFGLRHFRRVPITTATIIIVLAGGIGVNVALFTAMHSILTAPPPPIERDPELVRIRGSESTREAGRTRERRLSLQEVRAYASHRELFSDVVAWTVGDALLGLGTTIVPGSTFYVTEHYFRVLDVQLSLGAGLTEGPAANSLVAVISHALWSDRFGRSEDVLGKSIRVNDIELPIVGVAPRLLGRGDGRALSVFVPMSAYPVLERKPAAAMNSADFATLRAIARLQPGVSAQQATSVVEVVAQQSAGTMEVLPGVTRSADVAPLTVANDKVTNDPEIATAALAFGTITFLILLITCTNVGGLLVGLATARRREIAVRLSLGAARSRIIRQLLTESVLLALVATALAVAFIFTLLRVLSAHIPELQQFGIALHWPTALFAIGCGVATGIAFGISPALHATRLGVAAVLKDAAAHVASSSGRLQGKLVIAQIALSQPVLVGLAAVITTFSHDLGAWRLGEHDNEILLVEYQSEFRNAPAEQKRAGLQELQERIAAVPGVQHVAQQDRNTIWTRFVVHPADRLPTTNSLPFFGYYQPAPTGYFPAMTFPLLRGRDFTAEERHAARRSEGVSILIGRSLAERMWGDADPIGRRLADANTNPARSLTVIGIVDDTWMLEAEGNGWTPVYTADVLQGGSLVVRTRGPARPLIPVIRSVSATEVPELPLLRAVTRADRAAADLREVRGISAVAAGAGLLAVSLSAIALYATISLAVTQRTREIGIRAALGAKRRQIVRMFFSAGLRLSAIGLFIGLPISMLALRLVGAQLSVTWAPRGVVTMVTVVVLLAAGLASWFPSARAAGTSPLEALRAE